MALVGLDDTPPSFSDHPDFRQVATFALGWVFITSLRSIISSALIQRLAGYFRGRPSPPDAERYFGDEKLSLDLENTLAFRHGYSNTALFALALCFLFASVAQFGSLLAFSTNGDATCAFVVAWGAMAAQSGRLVGALIVIFELRRLGAARWEFWFAIGWLIVGIGFVFFNNAVAVGMLTPFKPLGVSYCDRKHFLPASLVSSLLYFSLEVYAIARVMLFLSADLKMRDIVQDIRVLRPVSLLFLELLTLVPSAVLTNVVAEFVPFSIGAVAVLLAFGHVQKPPPAETAPRMSSLTYSSYVTYPSVQRQPSQRSAQSIQPPSPSTPPMSRRHPFSAIALSDPTLQTTEWDPPASARSTRTIDIVTARSIRDAVVQGGRQVRVPSRDGSFLREEARKEVLDAAPATTPLGGMIVPSQVAFAEHLDQDSAQAASLSARPRPTIETPTQVLHEEDVVSDLISPASRIPASNFRISRFGEGPSRSRRTSFRTSYQTSFAADSPVSEDFVTPSVPPPVHDAGSTSSSERRRSTSFSQASTTGHSRSNSIPTRSRWPTFNANQFREAGYDQPNASSGRSRASSVSSPSTVHRPPPILLPPLPTAGIRKAPAPRGPRPPPLSASAQNLRFS